MLLFTRTVNSDFLSLDEGSECARPEDALAKAIDGAIWVAADEITGGAPSAAVEVSVETQDGTVLLRSVVTIAHAPLMIES